MARLKALRPKVATLAPRQLAVPASLQPAYGQGRGGRPWRRKVEAVKVRDQYTCQECGRITEDGECDHKVPVSEGGTDDMDNLQWLCRTPCHEEKTKEEAARGKARLHHGGSLSTRT